MTGAILAAKKARKTTWAAIAKAAGISEVYCTSAALGQNALDPAEAKKVSRFLRLSPKVAEALTEFATKAEAAPAIPKEPLQYRLQEIIYVYGPTIKEIIEEKFGAGIMSAIARFGVHVSGLQVERRDSQDDPGGSARVREEQEPGLRFQAFESFRLHEALINQKWASKQDS